MSKLVTDLLIILATYWLLIASSKINHILKCINSWYIFVQLYMYIYIYIHDYVHIYTIICTYIYTFICLVPCYLHIEL